MPDLSIESIYINNIVAGVDEVGRGAFAGPLVVGAVIINKDKPIQGIDDSKKLDMKKREELNQSICTNHIYSIGVASIEEINEIGLNPATFLAIDRALRALPLTPTLALIDGNYKNKFIIPHINIIKGDSKSVSIAAASIVAKVYRDNLMKDLACEFPMYSWETNVGYGTKSHMDGLKKHGHCKHHRLNYKPIQLNLLPNVGEG